MIAEVTRTLISSLSALMLKSLLWETPVHQTAVRTKIKKRNRASLETKLRLSRQFHVQQKMLHGHFTAVGEPVAKLSVSRMIHYLISEQNYA
jgi:hypothetical protein